MTSIIGCESSYKVNVQSNHRYSATNAPRGYREGDREQSFGLVQIHVPVHPVTKEQAVQPTFAVDFLAKNVAAGKASMWTCYTNLALKL